ncbi:MAG: hypothetical protein K2P98_00990 [Neisseriaceae bacterium]|nr:hypothetical protein [Neisseriaceae bacterium]
MKIQRILIIAILPFFLLTACANKVLETWQDPNLEAQTLLNIAVVGSFSDETTRRIFEDTLVASLKSQKIKAEITYNMLPSPVNEGLTVAANLLQQKSYDAVFYSHLIRIDVRQTNGYSPRFIVGGGSQGLGWGVNLPIGGGTYNNVYDTPIRESQLFDKKGKLIWSVTKEGNNNKKGELWANTVANSFLEKAKKENWLPKSEVE